MSNYKFTGFVFNNDDSIWSSCHWNKKSISYPHTFKNLIKDFNCECGRKTSYLNLLSNGKDLKFACDYCIENYENDIKENFKIRCYDCRDNQLLSSIECKYCSKEFERQFEFERHLFYYDRKTIVDRKTKFGKYPDLTIKELYGKDEKYFKELMKSGYFSESKKSAIIYILFGKRKIDYIKDQNREILSIGEIVKKDFEFFSELIKTNNQSFF